MAEIDVTVVLAMVMVILIVASMAAFAVIVLTVAIAAIPAIAVIVIYVVCHLGYPIVVNVEPKPHLQSSTSGDDPCPARGPYPPRCHRCCSYSSNCP